MKIFRRHQIKDDPKQELLTFVTNRKLRKGLEHEAPNSKESNKEKSENSNNYSSIRCLHSTTCLKSAFLDSQVMSSLREGPARACWPLMLVTQMLSHINTFLLSKVTRRVLLIVAGLRLHTLSVLFPRVVHWLAILYLWCLIEPVQFG